MFDCRTAVAASATGSRRTVAPSTVAATSSSAAKDNFIMGPSRVVGSQRTDTTARAHARASVLALVPTPGSSRKHLWVLRNNRDAGARRSQTSAADSDERQPFVIGRADQRCTTPLQQGRAGCQDRLKTAP